MIDLGLVMKIGAALGPSVPGGFPGTLPENMRGPAYAYTVISDRANVTLQSVTGLGMRRYQFDCFGPLAVDAKRLADAIDAVLNGFSGTLPDPDSTVVDSAIRSDRMGPKDSDSARNFWVMLEFEIWYYDTAVPSPAGGATWDETTATWDATSSTWSAI